MKIHYLRNEANVESECEYAVEFACASTYLVGFKDIPGLTEEEIIRRAVGIADSAFHKGGVLSVERSNSDGYYCFTVLGIDRSTGVLKGKYPKDRAHLRLIK